MDTECSLFGAFGGIVQLILGIVCFSSLAIKRFTEKPSRPWIIFILDSSKQGFSALVAHVMNVMSALILSQKKGNNPCLWYFITLILDTTLGILIAYIILKIIENVSKQYGWSKLISGNYSEETEEENDLAAWALQLMVWVTIVAVTKGFLLFSTLYFNSFFTQVGKYILDPFQSKPKAELVFVMIIVPTIMNIFQFWVQDNFLKSKI